MLASAPELLSTEVDGLRPTAPKPVNPWPIAPVSAASLLSACGGGSGDSAAPAPPPDPPPPPITDTQAARFLAQASLGITRTQIARVQTLGYAGWLDEQFALPPQGSRWDWLLTAGYGADADKNSQAGFDNTMWRKLIASPDTLRQRLTLALSELLVVSVDGLPGNNWKAFAAAAYADLLEANAFGTFRNLVQQVSTHPAMGSFLTFRGNTKANTSTGSLPDENYARELMQLFTIGLLELNLDGSLKLSSGQAQETYTQDDVSGLARVFTGWDWDRSTSTPDQPQAYQRTPMAQTASKHESGAKIFLGSTIPAGTDGATSLTLALDTICGHANVAPFVSRQLIQHLVTSNPSAAYVGRVAAVFVDNGSGTRGDLKALFKAILLDDEARNDGQLGDPAFGKLREPMLRFIAWARTFNLSSPGNTWALPNTSDPGTRLGQSPGRSPSVFNFFRPGYVPPNSAIASAGLEAPEFQITNESSVIGYINYMQNSLKGGSSVTPDYSAVLPLVTDTQALLDELNLLLAAGQLSAATLATMKIALDSVNVSSDTGKNNRLYAALTLVLAAPEFIVQK